MIAIETLVFLYDKLGNISVKKPKKVSLFTLMK